MDYIQSLLDSCNVPIISAFLLGLLTAISPCPLATNITAIGYISKSIDQRHRVFWSGVLYAAGRVVAYTALGAVLIPILREGASLFAIQKALASYGDKCLPPVLILIGLFMLFGDRLPLPKWGFSGQGSERLQRKGWLGAFGLGVLFALAFCPTSGVLYFGMLIPLSAAEPAGYWLPAIYAIATGLPVLAVAWILAFSISKIGQFYHLTQVLQKWMNRIIAALFITVGIYYAWVNYL